MAAPELGLGNYDANSYVCRGKEGAVAGGGDAGPIVVDDGDCPEDYAQGLVAARVKGSGRMVRFWLTGYDFGRDEFVRAATVRI